MKKLLLFVSFMFIASLCFGQNLVSNPGFESWTVNGAGGPPDDWELSHTSSFSAIQENTTIHGGSYSVKLEWTTTNNRDLQQIDIPVSAGNVYEFSSWVYDNDSSGRIAIYIRWEDNSGDYISNSTFVYSEDNTSWQQLTTGEVEAPTNTAQCEVRIRCYDVSGSWTGSATVYIDDVSLSQITSSNIINAYAISNDELEVFYSIDQTSVDPADYELTGSATITFSTATIDGTNPKLVHLSGASTSMADDNILDTISDEAKSTYDFYAGITSIAYTNTLNPGGTIDNTHTATFKGIISATDKDRYVWISDAAGAYNGVLIYDFSASALGDVGDEILISANRTTYNNLTELENTIFISKLSTGNAPYGPTVINGSDIEETIGVDTNPAESYEGQLCQIDTMTVVSYTDYDYRCSWEDPNTKTTYYFHVGDKVDYQFSMISLTIGSVYSNIIGVIDWDYYNNYYCINPRDDNDYTLLQDTTPPVISTIIVTDASTLEVYFNENVEETSAETTTNYTISSRDVAVTDAVLDAADAAHVTLTVTGMTYGDYTLLAIGVEDLSGNPSDDSHNFSYSSLPGPGDIVINEIMKDPSAVADANGEYFELYNATDHVIDINGWTVRDDGSDSLLIDNGGPLNIPSYGYLVLGNDGDPLTNGGYTCDYAYSGMYLANSDDEIILEFAGIIIDSVYWDGGTTFPDPTGASMELDPAHQNTVDNDNGANWYTAYTPYGDGDDGSPGSANPGPQLPAPIDVSIQINGSDVILNWSSGASKATYNIYRSLNPYDGFSLLDSTSDTTYTDTDAATSEFKYFYYITEE